MTRSFSIIALSLTLSIAACSAPDEAALAKGDEAFKGQIVEGQLRPVAARSVMVGTGGADAPACAAVVRPKGASARVRWSNDPTSPVKAEVGGELMSCERDGEWTGVIFPASGQRTDDCAVSERRRNPTDYQGPCRWGWVLSAELGAAV